MYKFLAICLFALIAVFATASASAKPGLIGTPLAYTVGAPYASAYYASPYAYGAYAAPYTAAAAYSAYPYSSTLLLRR